MKMNMLKKKSTRVLTLEELNSWYAKNIIKDSVQNTDVLDANTFQKIYNIKPYRQYESVIDNYSDYWFGNVSSFGSSRYPNGHTLYQLRGGSKEYWSKDKEVYGSSEGYTRYLYGLRMLITLKPNVETQMSGDKNREIIDSRDSNTTWKYNTWSIK